MELNNESRCMLHLTRSSFTPRLWPWQTNRLQDREREGRFRKKNGRAWNVCSWVRPVPVPSALSLERRGGFFLFYFFQWHLPATPFSMYCHCSGTFLFFKYESSTSYIATPAHRTAPHCRESLLMLTSSSCGSWLRPFKQFPRTNLTSSSHIL